MAKKLRGYLPENGGSGETVIPDHIIRKAADMAEGKRR